MKTYEITFALPYSDGQAKLAIRATDNETAQKLGDALAESMPSETVYFSKSDRDITVDWRADANEVTS